MKHQLHEPVAEERGALLERWVLGLLRARQAYAGLFDELARWGAGAARRTIRALICRRRGR